jgi:hypothetical protein
VVLYVFARTGQDRWDVIDQTTRPGPDDVFLARVHASQPLAANPWAVAICLEPDAVTLHELMMHWGMAPGSDPNPDRLMRAFLAVAHSKRPPGGGRWVTPASCTAVVAENRLAEWEAGIASRPARRPWWRIWDR